jgi:hypothetical protein
VICARRRKLGLGRLLRPDAARRLCGEVGEQTDRTTASIIGAPDGWGSESYGRRFTRAVPFALAPIRLAELRTARPFRRLAQHAGPAAAGGSGPTLFFVYLRNSILQLRNQ